MLEKVWDKGEAYYKGYMLGVIIAEVESYREVVTILRAYKKKDRAAIVDEMQKMCKTDIYLLNMQQNMFWKRANFFIADRRKE